MAAAPDSVPRTGEIKIDLLVLVFHAGRFGAGGVHLRAGPMAQLRERNLATWLHGSSKGVGTGSGGQLLRKSLVVTEIALAVVQVVGSGLMIRAFWKLRSVNLGFNPIGLLSFTVALPPSAYKIPDQLRFSQTLQAKLASLPGVEIRRDGR